jgi:hypothetical protein
MEEKKYKTKHESIEELLGEKKPKTVGLLSCWHQSHGLWTLDKDIALLCEFSGIEMGHLWPRPSSFPRTTPLLEDHYGQKFDLVIVGYECPCGAGGGLLIPEYSTEIKEKGITDQVYFAARTGIQCLEHELISLSECGLKGGEKLIPLLEEWGVGISKKMEERVSRIDRELKEKVGEDVRKFPHQLEMLYPVPKRSWMMG